MSWIGRSGKSPASAPRTPATNNNKSAAVVKTRGVPGMRDLVSGVELAMSLPQLAHDRNCAASVGAMIFLRPIGCAKLPAGSDFAQGHRMPEIEVCRENELAEGAVRIVRIKDLEIAVIRHGGAYYAYHNHCPHQGGPACEGVRMPQV